MKKKTVLQEKKDPSVEFVEKLLTSIDGLTGNFSLLKERVDQLDQTLHYLATHVSYLNHQVEQSKFIVDFKASGFEYEGEYDNNYKFNSKQESFVTEE